MKRQVQQTGIRKWYGDDFLDIQNESIAAIEAHYAPYGSCIIKGCEVSGNDIAPGIVFIDGKIQRFLGSTVSKFPCYLKMSMRKETREYKTGGSKDVAEIYEAVVSETIPTGDYITITTTGGRTFRQAFQDANNRMVSDSKISEWNGSKNSAINTIRGTITSAYNTLGKLYNWASGAIATAKSEAINTAKDDATTKANLAKSSAIATATAEVRGEDVGSESPKFSLKKLYDWTVGKLANKPNWDKAYDQITNLEIGGRNLQKGTGLITDVPLVMWGSASLSEIRRDENIPYVHVEVSANNNTSCCINMSAWGFLSYEQGEEYVLSFEGRGTIDCFNYNYQMQPEGGNNSLSTNYTNKITEDNWTKIKTSFISAFTTDIGYLLIGILAQAGKWYDVRNIKLEKGNIATDWTPAPKDIVEDSKKLEGHAADYFAKKNGSIAQDFSCKILSAWDKDSHRVSVYSGRIIYINGNTGEQYPLGLNGNKTIKANPDGTFEAKNIVIKK